MSKATLTGVVGTLEGRGLVARRRHAQDGRLVIVGLTPTGRRMIRRLYLLREVLRAVEAADADPAG